jgi:Smg protein
MMTGTVLDILIYVFDRYMLDEVPEVRALDWLADLALERDRPPLAIGPLATGALRIYSDGELVRLSTECRGFLVTLERLGILSPQQREIVIDRMLALDADELDTEQLKWVVLMVLSSQPGQEQAFERLEDLVSDVHPNTPH